MTSPLCNTGIFANDVLCEVIDQLDDTKTLANSLKDSAVDQLETFQAAALNQVSGYENIDYSGPEDSITFSPEATVRVNIFNDSASGFEPDFSGTLPSAPDIPEAPSLESAVVIEDGPAVPAAYSVGSADTTLIGEDGFDDVYNRAKAREARTSLKEERDAQYLASAQGIGMASSAILKKLDLAQQETNVKISEVTLQREAEEALALREDVKTLHELNITNWPLKPQLDQSKWSTKEELDVRAYEAYNNAISAVYGAASNGIAGIYSAQLDGIIGYINAETSRYNARLEAIKTNLAYEAEKRGWKEVELRRELENAEKQTAFALQKAQDTLGIVREAEQAIAQLMVGLTQGLYSSLDYGLTGTGNQNVNESISS
jgi:hypothetical protein